MPLKSEHAAAEIEKLYNEKPAQYSEDIPAIPAIQRRAESGRDPRRGARRPRKWLARKRVGEKGHPGRIPHGRIVDMSIDRARQPFFDKST